MDLNAIIQKLGMLTAITLPLWNIPLIWRIVKRRSSDDISLSWAVGVWVSFVLMAPSGFQSSDPIWRVYNIMNLILFSAVTFCVVFYHKKKEDRK